MGSESLKITVYGGTGRIGQRIVDEALNRGHTVTVVARDPSREAQQHERLKVIKGDILDTKGVAEQMAGQDVIVNAVSGFNLERDFFPNVAKSLVTAARSVSGKSPRLIFVGGASALPTEPGGQPPAITSPNGRPFAQGKVDVFEYLQTVKDVSWAVLAPPTEIEPGERTGKFRVGNGVLLHDENGKSRISTEDYAVAMLDEIENPKHIRSQFTVAY
jgi:putative NADH-flavin reductase